jgi:polyisoprenoid-binding protein YceI
MFRQIIAAFSVLVLLPALSAHATSKIFDFKDPKETNAISLGIDSALEPVVGYASDISGSCLFDPEHPEKTTGVLSVQVESIKFSHPGYTNTAQNYALNKEKFPTITCKLNKILSGRVVKSGVYEGSVLVDFTCKGITKALTVPLSVRYFPGQAKLRTPNLSGDLLSVRSKFKIKRSDFGIAEGVAEVLVSQDVEVSVAVIGTCATAVAAPKEKAEEKKPESAMNSTVAGAGKSVAVKERMAFHKVPGMSATVTAIAALRAADQGQIDLDKSINANLKSWKLAWEAINSIAKQDGWSEV